MFDTNDVRNDVDSTEVLAYSSDGDNIIDDFDYDDEPFVIDYEEDDDEYHSLGDEWLEASHEEEMQAKVSRYNKDNFFFS